MSNAKTILTAERKADSKACGNASPARLGFRAKRRALVLFCIASPCLFFAACSGGGGGGGNGGGGGSGTLIPFAISAAGNVGMATNLLVAGDAFEAETDPVQRTALGDQIWNVVTSINTWVGTNPTFTYQFYVDTDPFTNWGRAFRYTGFGVYAGPIRIPPTSGPGTYTAANGDTFQAVILQTWDDTYWEILIVQDGTTFVHAVQNVNGLPIVETYGDTESMRRPHPSARSSL